jgi:hypothetical protein
MSGRYRISVVLALATLLAAATSAFADQLVLQPGPSDGQDTWVGADYPYDPHGYEGWLRFGGYSGSEYRLYIRFDLSGIDPSSNITTAQLELFQFVHNGWIEYNYSVMQVTGAWTESLTWDSQPAFDPVAVTAFSGTPWQYGINMWHAIGGLENLVRFWLDNPGQNHGLMIKPTTDFYGYAEIWSSDYGSSSLRPKLVLDGTIVGNEEIGWGRVKRLFR